MYWQYANINRIDKYKNKYKQFEYWLNDIWIYNTIEEYTIWKNISDFMYKYEI